MKRILSIFLFATSVFAADKPLVLRAARLIDGRGGSVIAPAMIVVRGNRIESIGGVTPADAETIDLGDMTLLPGLIDAHTHVLLQGDVTSADYDVQLFRESLPYRALRASQIELLEANAELRSSNQKLEDALSRVKQLSGLLPICSYCKRIRNDQNYWEQVDRYVAQHSEAQFTHGICPACVETVIAEVDAHKPRR